LEDCHSIDPREADVAVTQSAGLLQLSARADSGCVWTGLDPSPASRTYQVTVDYRTVSGQPARVCIWEVGPDRCILQPGLVASDGWHHFVAQFVADAGTEQLRLYVYADGQADPPTEVDYRHLGLRPVLPVSITVLQLPTTFRRTSSRVSVIGVHPGRVNVRLNCMAGRVLLVLTESYAPGWQLTGLPRTWRARHLVIDGYANGWLVTGRGNAELALEYAPERAAEAANRASALALAAAALGYPISRRRSRAGRRRRTTLLGRP
jgi:arabinofuranan 3-O-arabinosyltransferase